MLPEEFKSQPGEVNIPRSGKRTMLAKVGKIELNSAMEKVLCLP